MSPHTHESTSKKRKIHPEPASSTKKKSKKSSRTDADSEGEFHVINASLTLSVPPIFANNPRAGVEEMLDSMVMRYIPAFRGIVLSHSSLSFTNRHATIKTDCPFLVCDVRFDATVWSPKVGMSIVGKVNLCSPDHLSLLIHRTFNASIPRHHIPENWDFHYGPAENDPEFGPNAQLDEDSEEKQLEQGAQESAGKWVNRETGQNLGGDLEELEFTVIGLTVANEMLSLQGSIQPDPFSPLHVPRMDTTRQSAEIEADTAEFEKELDDNSDEDIGIKADAFKWLDHRAAEAASTDEQAQKQGGAQTGTEAPKKKKRKGEKVEEVVSKLKRKKTK